MLNCSDDCPEQASFTDGSIPIIYPQFFGRPDPPIAYATCDWNVCEARAVRLAFRGEGCISASATSTWGTAGSPASSRPPLGCIRKWIRASSSARQEQQLLGASCI